MRVLIAEDDVVSRRVLEAMLSKWGYEVVVTSTGTEAWEILRRNDAPRLAILDWMMPGMDGLQITRNIRRLGEEPYTYILLLTAKNRKQDIVDGISAGADDYVTKPFDASELKARLNAGARIIDLQSELLTVREALRNQATHDMLTGLPNRLLFGDRLSQSLVRARSENESLAVMFMDLDGFKLINDTLGHDVGDNLLQGVADRLTNALREVDTIARMGGDEFTAVLDGVGTAEVATAVAQKILASFTEPFIVPGRELFVTASVGISLYPIHGDNAEELVRNADAAMYRAKELGRNTYSVYSEVLNEVALERLALEHGLRKVLDLNELMVYYQPRVDIRTGQTCGAEALIRWIHPTMGVILPGQFIPIAEEAGLLGPISEWVLRTACAQNKAWQDAGLTPIDMGVNISVRQFQSSDLVETIRNVLDETGMNANNLDIELTESTLMQNPDHAIRVLHDLKDMGVRTSLDDFGTGYSSLSHLKQFPLHSVKIDQSFVKDITSDPDDAAIAGAVIAMAHSLKLRVIAEGVETVEQLEFLQSLDCDEMQGYFISRPVPAEELAQILRTTQFMSIDKKAA